MSTLLLNADMQPVSLLPLSIVDWQESIRYIVLDKVEVLEWHDDWVVHSARWSTRVPAVIMLHEYQKPKSTMTAEQQTFTQKFKTPPSKVDKTRKITQRQVQYRGVSMKKNGRRRGDVKSDTLKKRRISYPLFKDSGRPTIL